MMRKALRIAALISIAALAPSIALAQEEQPNDAEELGPDWPDPGSEEPGGPKLFPRAPTSSEYDEGADVELDVPEDIAEPVYRWSWYGWRNLIGDGLAGVLLVSFFVTGLESAPLLISSATTYAVGGPIAHFTAGNWGRALISFGMRVVGPGLFALAFFATMCAVDAGCGDDDVTLPVVGLGGFVGAWVAAGLDIGLVARHQVQVAPKSNFAFVPVIGATPNGPKTLGLLVQF